MFCTSQEGVKFADLKVLHLVACCVILRGGKAERKASVGLQYGLNGLSRDVRFQDVWVYGVRAAKVSVVPHTEIVPCYESPGWSHGFVHMLGDMLESVHDF